MLQVKEWFLNKNFEGQSYAMSVADRIEVLKETEKAYQLKFVTEYGNIVSWVPKSCTFEAEPKQHEFVIRFTDNTKMVFDTREEMDAWLKINMKRRD